MYRTLIATAGFALLSSTAFASCPASLADCPNGNANTMTMNGLTAATAAVAGTTNGITITAKTTKDTNGYLGTWVDEPTGQQLILGHLGTTVMQPTFWNMPKPGDYTPIFNLVGNPSQILSIGATVTGTYGAGVAPWNQIYINDTADHHLQGDAAPALNISVNSGGIGFGEALSVGCGTTANNIKNTSLNFMTCFEMRNGPAHNAGGTSASDPYGQANVMNPYALLQPGATYWILNSQGEFDISNAYGSSSLLQVQQQWARLGNDWGIAGFAGANRGPGGRIGLWMDSQQPTYDGTSVGSATASAGTNLPGYSSFINFGSGSQEWIGGPIPGGTNSKIMSVGYQQIYANNNSCTVGLANCSATTAAAIVKPQTSGWGIDLSDVDFITSAWSSPGINILGTGEVDVGNILITPQIYGGSIDVQGSYISAVTYVSGSNIHAVGEYLYGTCVDQLNNPIGTAPGLILKVTAVSAGIPTAFQIRSPAYSHNSAATQNAAGNITLCGRGTNTITPTWTDAKFGGTAYELNLLPSGGIVALPGGFSASTTGGPRSTSNLELTGADFFTDTAGHGSFYATAASGNAYFGSLGGSFTGLKNSSSFIVWDYDNAGTSGVTGTPLVIFAPLATNTVRDVSRVNIVPLTGDTVIIAQSTRTELIKPAGTLATLTIQLPTCSAAFDGDTKRYSSTTNITALTITAPGSGIGTGAPSSLTAGAGNEWLCDSSVNAWYRLY